MSTSASAWIAVIGIGIGLASPAHADDETPTKAEGLARCKKGELAACTYVGQLARDEGNYAEALAYMVRGCSAKYELGCTTLGQFYLHSFDKLTKVDARKTLASTKSACDKGDARACYLQGQAERGGADVTDMKSVDAANARAFKAFDRACDGKYVEACDELADVYAYGFGMPRDNDKAKAYWQRACDLGDKHACIKRDHPSFNTP